VRFRRGAGEALLEGFDVERRARLQLEKGEGIKAHRENWKLKPVILSLSKDLARSHGGALSSKVGY
jgi:hypothetical protein